MQAGVASEQIERLGVVPKVNGGSRLIPRIIAYDWLQRTKFQPANPEFLRVAVSINTGSPHRKAGKPRRHVGRNYRRVASPGYPRIALGPSVTRANKSDLMRFRSLADFTPNFVIEQRIQICHLATSFAREEAIGVGYPLATIFHPPIEAVVDENLSQLLLPPIDPLRVSETNVTVGEGFTQQIDTRRSRDHAVIITDVVHSIALVRILGFVPIQWICLGSTSLASSVTSP